MPFQPRSSEDTYESILTNIASGIDRLTNFVSGSFNDRLAASYSEQIREAEIKALAAELAGYVDYAGKELTEEDLETLGIDGVDPEEINQYMHDEQLDLLAANWSVERDPGSKATGQAVIQTSDDTTRIPEGYEIGTEKDLDGNYLSFQVDADGDGEISDDSDAYVQPESGSTEVTVDIIAADYGSEYNVGSDTITYIPTPKPGVQSVTNPDPTDGGEDEQTNPSLRDDVRVALVASAEGGTTDGIIRYIEENNDDVRNVGIDEFLDSSPPFVDVVVEGGLSDDVKELIEGSRPAGIRHNLVRPTEIQVGVYTQVIGEGTSTTNVETDISRYLSRLSVSDRFYSSELQSDIYTSDTDISSVPSVSTYITSITEEQYAYDSGQATYPVRFGRFGYINDEQHRFVDMAETSTIYTYYDDFDSSSLTVVATVDEDDIELVQGSDNDYTIVTDSDGVNIGFELTGNTVPDESTTMEISYVHSNWSLDSVVSESDTTFTQGTDYTVVDDDGDGYEDAIQWLDGGSTPDDGERFHISYTPYRTFRGDLSSDDRELFVPSDNWITAELVEE